MILLPSLQIPYRKYVYPLLPPALRSLIRILFHAVVTRLLVPYNRARVTRPVTRLLGPQYRRSLRRIEIDITYVCNLACHNCNRSVDQAPTPLHMSLAQIERFVAESVQQGVQWERIRLLGGEPTLHRQFFEILDCLRTYRRDFSPATQIVVATNGHGRKVCAVLERIPDDVLVENTSKTGNLQPSFASFNVAPIDLEEYASADFTNGCAIIEDCGFGLTPSGYYPCAVAGNVDRVFGWNLGRKALPPDSDRMEDLLTKFCGHCGLFKRCVDRPLAGPLVSRTWQAAYARYEHAKPLLSAYADDAQQIRSGIGDTIPRSRKSH